MALKTRVTVAISEDLLRDIDRLADAQGRSRSDYMERCIRDQVRNESVTLKLLQDPVVGPAMVGAFSDPAVLRAMTDRVGEKLSDDELTLFHQALQQISQQATKPPGKGKGKQTKQSTKGRRR